MAPASPFSRSRWAAAALLQLAALDVADRLQVNNVEPRRDTSGAILNAHDGAMYHVDGRYYLVGTSYEACEG